jgi:hypothetical protein
MPFGVVIIGAPGCAAAVDGVVGSAVGPLKSSEKAEVSGLVETTLVSSSCLQETNPKATKTIHDTIFFITILFFDNIKYTSFIKQNNKLAVILKNSNRYSN